MNVNDPCPCHSGKSYGTCCQLYHLGELPVPEALMRSRYSAYALGLVDYIINTTHPEHPLFKEDPDKTRSGIVLFSQQTSFDGLIILKAFQTSDKEAFVHFHAILKQKDIDTSFIEESLFLKENGRWLYRSGKHR